LTGNGKSKSFTVGGGVSGIRGIGSFVGVQTEFLKKGGKNKSTIESQGKIPSVWGGRNKREKVGGVWKKAVFGKGMEKW